MKNPRIRFKKKDGSEYGDWNDKPFDALFEEYVATNDGSHMQYTAGKYGLKLIDEEKVRYDISKHKQFNPNSLILGIGIEEVGVSADKIGCVSPIYTTFAINNSNVNTNFIDYYIKGVFDKNKGKVTHKSTRRDFEFETKELHKLNIPIPSDIEEQTKIASFLSEIDTLIKSAENEVEATKRLKKAMLQKMFPKKGEKVPEVRFPGFTDDWEQCKLGEYFTKYQNTVYLDDDTAYRQISIRNNGTVEYRCTNYGSVIGRKRQYVIDTENHPDTLTFTRQTVYEGGIGFVPPELNGAIVTENMPLLDMHDADKWFMKTLFLTEGYYKSVVEDNTLIGSAQKALHEKQWLESIVFIPSLNEQKTIGTFFEQIDNLITLHQCKVDAYKNLKKSIMQKMFI